MFDGRTNLSLQVANEVKKYFKRAVFRAVIPRNVRLSEAPSHLKPLLLMTEPQRALRLMLILPVKSFKTTHKGGHYHGG
jgi:chromosome partitioning protein